MYVPLFKFGKIVLAIASLGQHGERGGHKKQIDDGDHTIISSAEAPRMCSGAHKKIS